MRASESQGREDAIRLYQGKGNNWDIAPTPPGSAAADQWHARVDRADVAGVARDDTKGRSKIAQSGRKPAGTGADMSGREETLAKKDRPDWDKNKDAVKWEEPVLKSSISPPA